MLQLDVQAIHLSVYLLKMVIGRQTAAYHTLVKGVWLPPLLYNLEFKLPSNRDILQRIARVTCDWTKVGAEKGPAECATCSLIQLARASTTSICRPLLCPTAVGTLGLFCSGPVWSSLFAIVHHGLADSSCVPMQPERWKAVVKATELAASTTDETAAAEAAAAEGGMNCVSYAVMGPGQAGTDGFLHLQLVSTSELPSRGSARF